ncbi:MAG: 4Fe-4S binding protein [Verrucomicrobiota bacterium]
MSIFLGFVLLNATAFAEQRFPPPDFESGYHLPPTATPAPRAEYMQYVDGMVLLGALALALWFVYRSRSRRGITALSIFSLAYFGFYRKGCVCAIGSVQNVALALCDSHYVLPLTVLVFFLAPLLVALFAGRAFCAAVCPQGALQDLVLIRPIKVPAWLEAALGIIPHLFLGAGVIFAATGNGFLICRFDPMVPFFRFSGSLLMITLGGAFLVVGMFVGRPYCRFLCPYGALLRLVTVAAKWRVRVTPDTCTQCALCQHSCPFGAMREPTPQKSEPLPSARRRLAGLLLLLPVLMGLCAWGGSKLALASHFAELGGWVFGAWAGLVIGGKLTALSVRHNRTDFEPDSSACFACARCFETCPSERMRRGLIPLEPVHKEE